MTCKDNQDAAYRYTARQDAAYVVVVGSDWSLDELRWHWGSAYVISYRAGGRWTAERRDTCEPLCAGSAGALVLKIRADYFARPVPRDLPGRPRGGRGPEPGLTRG